MSWTLYHLADWPELVDAVARAGPDATKRFALDLLREVGTGDRCAAAVSTESRGNNANLRRFTAVLEQVELPGTPEVIERLEGSVA